VNKLIQSYFLVRPFRDFSENREKDERNMNRKEDHRHLTLAAGYLVSL